MNILCVGVRATPLSMFRYAEVLAYAQSLKGIRNPGGLAVVYWRSGEMAGTGTWGASPAYYFAAPTHSFISGQAFSEGIEEYQIEGVTIRVYSVAKTVADCFKYRNKIGLDVALEALRECRRERRATADEIQHYAEVCRVANVMSPYLEALW